MSEYTILYVDDEETNLRIFKTAFKREYNILVATSGKEAIELLRQNPVQLLITDQKMPEMSGTELLENTIEEFPDIIRIILTGFSDIESIVKAVNKAGIYKYITKPWDRGEMKLTIDKALENYKLKNDKVDLINQLKEANEQLEAKVQQRTKELEDAYHKVTSSIQYAQRIQNAMLPKEDKFKSIFKEHFVFYKPKDIVSGDFYWLAAKKEDGQNKVIIAMVDCTGHGVPGAFMSMIGDSLLNHIIHDKEVHSPEKILTLLDTGVQTHLQQDISENKDGMDASIVVIDYSEQKVYFSGAKQNMLYSKNGVLEEIKGEKLSIGFQIKRDEEQSYILHTLDLATIDSFYLYTDGFQDQFGGENDRKIGVSALKDTLQGVLQQSLEQQKQQVEKVLTTWMGKTPQIDDISVLGVKV